MSSAVNDGVIEGTERDGRVRDEKEAVQERTFTKWINMHLKRCDPPLQVNDLFTDVQNGKVLMALLEELSGCNMLNRFRPFTHRIFRINNIAKVLNFLEDRNVSLIHIDADDIADGKPSAVLRLIWNIIVYYQIKQVTVNLKKKFSSTFSLLSCSSDSPVSPADDMYNTLPSKGKRSSQNLKYRGTAIKTLFRWAQHCTAKYGVEIHDFGKSWRSGLAFLAMVKSFCPESVDMRKALTSEPQLNMETAFTVAYERLGIPPLLNPKDISVHSPDEQSVITYVAQFLECYPDHMEDYVSTDHSRDTPDSTERCDNISADSDSCVLSSKVKGLQNPSEHQNHSQHLTCTSVKSFGPISSQAETSSCAHGQLLSDSTEGQCCDYTAWERSVMSLEDDGRCSESSAESIYTLPVFDSDEEDAYSYILQLDHKDAALENSNVDLKLNLIMDARETELTVDCDLVKASPVDPENERTATTNTFHLLKDHEIDTRCADETAVPSSDESLDFLDEQERIDSESHIASLLMENDLEEDRDGEGYFLHAVKDSVIKNLMDKDQYDEYNVTVQSVIYGNTGEHTVSQTQREGGLAVTFNSAGFEPEKLNLLLLLWLIIYCILMWTSHLDIFSLLSPN